MWTAGVTWHSPWVGDPAAAALSFVLRNLPGCSRQHWGVVASLLFRNRASEPAAAVGTAGALRRTSLRIAAAAASPKRRHRQQALAGRTWQDRWVSSVVARALAAPEIRYANRVHGTPPQPSAGSQSIDYKRVFSVSPPTQYVGDFLHHMRFSGFRKTDLVRFAGVSARSMGSGLVRCGSFRALISVRQTPFFGLFSLTPWRRNFVTIGLVRAHTTVATGWRRRQPHRCSRICC
jgi:hypothetical protein